MTTELATELVTELATGRTPRAHAPGGDEESTGAVTPLAESAAKLEPVQPAASKGERKRTMTIAIVYILISVCVGAVGQIMLKQGMLNNGQMTLAFGDLGQTLWKLATNPFVVFGLALYASGTVFWLAALSRVDLSYAYPFASLSYVVMLLASWQLFDENITPLRLLGTGVVMLGVFLISRT
jgi:multidrug transporter EmrE-like cation transporter